MHRFFLAPLPTPNDTNCVCDAKPILLIHDKLMISYMHELCVLQCVPEKRKPINQVNFLKTVMIYQKKFTLLENSIYPLSFDTRYKMYWPYMAKHKPFQIVMSTLICAE